MVRDSSPAPFDNTVIACRILGVESGERAEAPPFVMYQGRGTLMDTVKSSTPATGQVSRRRVVQGMAWATPAILIATSAPAFANGSVSACEAVPNGTAATVLGAWSTTSGGISPAAETGWTPTGGGSGYATQNWGAPNTAGFLSMANNTSSRNSAVVRVQYTFDSVVDAVYRIDFDVWVGYGSGSSTSRQNLVVSTVDKTGARDLTKLTVTHPNGSPTLGSNNSTDAQMTANGYELRVAQTTKNYTPTLIGTGGQITVTFTFTIQPKRSSGSSPVGDDIWVSKPAVTKIGCAS